MPMRRTTIRRMFNPAHNFLASRRTTIADDEGLDCDALAAYCILGARANSFAAAAAALEQVRHAALYGHDTACRALDRSLGCLLGNVVGDALGAPLEFVDIRYGVSELTSMNDEFIWQKEGYNSFGIKPGQWTDDASMALCLADTLLICGRLDAIDLRQRFWLWHKFGYNNAFGHDVDSEYRGSVGLGGNMSLSICEWEEQCDRTSRTQSGDRFTNGNGTIIRNGAIPVWFRNDEEGGMQSAYEQSKTTHGGEEAAELCRLLTFVCTRFINGAGCDLLDDLSEFETPLYTVKCLSNAQCEESHDHNAHPVFGGLENRQWDWKSTDHRYCSLRTQQDRTYIGSYAMDCMSMALHCVYSTKSFEEATLKAANLGGDSDSVCAVVGQLAGALYGASAIPPEWLQRVQPWDGGSIAARALMLHNHEKLGLEAALEDSACDTATLLGTPVTYLEM